MPVRLRLWIHTAYVPAEQLLALGRKAEETGWYGLTVPDHVTYPRALNSHHGHAAELFPAGTPWPDTWVAIGALAGATTTLQLASGIYVAPMRSPLQVAKHVSIAAILSGYRLRCGLSAGWLREEFEQLGQEFATRGERLDEMIEVMRQVWQGGWVEHHGRFYDFEPFEMAPAPQRPIPILIGGDSERAMRRAARNDGWIGVIYTLSQAVDKVAEINRYRRDAGTIDRDDFEIMFQLERVPTVDEIRRMEEIGVTSLYLAPWELDTPVMVNPGEQALLRSVEEYAERVLSKL